MLGAEERRDAAEAARWVRRAWWLIAGVFVARLLYVAFLPFEMSGDEMYYWEWGRRLDWGYFSKPPLIGWLMGGVGALAGASAFAVKGTALLLGTASLGFVFALGRGIFGARTGFYGVLITVVTPGNAVLNFALTIDAPLLFAWTGGLLCLWRALEPEARHRLGWALGVLAFGALGVLAKQMMLVFFVCAAIFLALGRADRRWLRHWASWAVLLGSLAALLPPLIWNARNEWITFTHTAHHFEAKPFSLLEVLSRAGEFLGTQLGLFSPVLFVLLAVVVGVGVTRFWRWERGARFLFCFSGLPLVAMLLLLLRQELLANWGAVFYAAGAILLAGWSTGHLPSVAPRLRSWVRPGLAVGAALSLFLYLLPLLIEPLGLKGGRLDPTIRLRGWSAYAEAIDTARERHFASEPPIWVVGHRYQVSALAFYLPDHPRPYHWFEPGTIPSQYALWPTPNEAVTPGTDFLIVQVVKTLDDPAPLPEGLHQSFAQITPLESLTIPLGTDRHRHYRLYCGQSLKITQ